LTQFRGVNQEEEKARRFAFGVRYIWVHQSYRKRGFAATLLDTARHHFVYSYTVDMKEIAFTQLTMEGFQFASKYLKSASVPCYGSTVENTVLVEDPDRHALNSLSADSTVRTVVGLQPQSTKKVKRRYSEMININNNSW
jgi:hypothetical protein